MTVRCTAAQAAPAPPGAPAGVTVFANATINKTKSYPCIAPRVQKHAPPRLYGNATYRRTLALIANQLDQYEKSINPDLPTCLTCL